MQKTFRSLIPDRQAYQDGRVVPPALPGTVLSDVGRERKKAFFFSLRLRFFSFGVAPPFLLPQDSLNLNIQGLYATVVFWTTQSASSILFGCIVRSQDDARRPSRTDNNRSTRGQDKSLPPATSNRACHVTSSRRLIIRRWFGGCSFLGCARVDNCRYGGDVSFFFFFFFPIVMSIAHVCICNQAFQPAEQTMRYWIMEYTVRSRP